MDSLFAVLHVAWLIVCVCILCWTISDMFKFVRELPELLTDLIAAGVRKALKREP